MRKQSREVVFKLLFANRYGQTDIKQDFDVMLDIILKDMNLTKEEIDTTYVFNTYNAITSDFERLCDIVYAKVDKYTNKRIYNADLIILVLALYELEQKSLDNRIIIDSAIKLAKKYSTQNSIKFVNGILGAVIKEQND